MLSHLRAENKAVAAHFRRRRLPRRLVFHHRLHPRLPLANGSRLSHRHYRRECARRCEGSGSPTCRLHTNAATDCRPHRDRHRLPNADRKAYGSQELSRQEFGGGRDPRFNEHNLQRQNRHADAKSNDRRAHVVRLAHYNLRHNREFRRRHSGRTAR